jgi:error-prone DNA polymerase
VGLFKRFNAKTILILQNASVKSHQDHEIPKKLELREQKDGDYVRTVGCIIARRCPSTAKGFIFLSMEDETGIVNVIVTPT